MFQPFNFYAKFATIERKTNEQIFQAYQKFHTKQTIPTEGIIQVKAR